MSPRIEQCLLQESEIVLTVRIPLNLEAQRPLEHLANEGKIEEGVRAVGLAATQRVYQEMAKHHEETPGYRNGDGYWMRQVGKSSVDYVCPYGPFEVERPRFYNDQTGSGEVPFEHETRMEAHKMTPMLQYVALRKLAEKGPEAAAAAFEDERGLKISHHLLDRFLEDSGWVYTEEVRDGSLEEFLKKDWRPCWLPPVTRVSEAEADPAPTVGSQEKMREGSREERPPEGTQRGTFPVVQMDAMTVTTRHYAEPTEENPDGRRYQTERHQLHNAVVGFIAPEGPREAGDKIELDSKRYFSEYYKPNALPEYARTYLQACGVKPGDEVGLYGDGDEKIWERYREAMKGYRRTEVLDERHCRSNLREMSEYAYPNDEQRQVQWVETRLDDLYEAHYDAFFNALNYLVKRSKGESPSEKLKTKRSYFRRNQHRIRYADFLQRGLPISTCFVESAHNHVIGDRVRKNGRSYAEYRLQMIVDFRCEYKSKRLARVFERILEVAA